MSFFNIFSKRRLSKKRQEHLENANAFIQVHYVREKNFYNILKLKENPEQLECDEWYNTHDNPTTFSDAFNAYLKDKSIDINKLSNSYHLDSQILSRLNSEQHFTVSKGDAVAICLALKLNLAHSRKLLELSGYSLTNSSKSDLTIRYCIENSYNSYNDVTYLLNEICNIRLKDIS
ncbi:MAG: hypothetical protein E7270_10235 [Lachnospiraceae bacterium]|nr:hypothetical protein [Lachnospiraceae bacterium]MBQ4069593.1 hypothetical protein [Lachnospiraceae bacterium]